MTDGIRISFELDGIDELRRTCEELSGHLDAALRLMEQLQGEHVMVPRAVTRLGGRTTPRSAGTSSGGGAS